MALPASFSPGWPPERPGVAAGPEVSVQLSYPCPCAGDKTSSSFPHPVPPRPRPGLSECLPQDLELSKITPFLILGDKPGLIEPRQRPVQKAPQGSL